MVFKTVNSMFQHTAARRRLGDIGWDDTKIVDVSTHSRPKAAGSIKPVGRKLYEWFQHTAARRRLGALIWPERWTKCFNTQPPEGGWAKNGCYCRARKNVSTHSRPKAAGAEMQASAIATALFQHTAARRRLEFKKAGSPQKLDRFNTQPPEGGWADY